MLGRNKLLLGRRQRLKTWSTHGFVVSISARGVGATIHGVCRRLLGRKPLSRSSMFHRHGLRGEDVPKRVTLDATSTLNPAPST